MIAGHLQFEIRNIQEGARQAVSNSYRKFHHGVIVSQVMQPIISLRASAIGDHPAILDHAYQLLNNGMINAHHGKPIERNILDKSQIGFLGLFKTAVMVKMFRINIGDDHHIRRKFYERAIRLV